MTWSAVTVRGRPACRTRARRSRRCSSSPRRGPAELDPVAPDRVGDRLRELLVAAGDVELLVRLAEDREPVRIRLVSRAGRRDSRHAWSLVSAPYSSVYAASRRRPSCEPCPPGTYARSSRRRRGGRATAPSASSCSRSSDSPRRRSAGRAPVDRPEVPVGRSRGSSRRGSRTSRRCPVGWAAIRSTRQPEALREPRIVSWAVSISSPQNSEIWPFDQ